MVSYSKLNRSGKLRKRKEESSHNGIAGVMIIVIDICNDNKNHTHVGSSVRKVINKESHIMLIENLPLADLYTMIQQHKLHMEFLKYNDMLSGEKKTKIAEIFDFTFEIIEGRSTEKVETGVQTIIILVVTAN